MSKIFLCSLLLSLTSCFYGKVKINAYDRTFIPYLQTNRLVFINSKNITDTILLNKQLLRTSNLDFFIDRGLGRTNDSKRPYYESYSSEVSLPRTITKISTNQPYIKYDPFIFSFFKHQDDPIIQLYYHIDGRWSGTIRFDTVQTETILLDGKVYTDVISVRTDPADLFQIDKMYWSLKFGLIKIDEKNGDQWTIVNIIKQEE